jgi:hypothetical protein
MLVKINNRIIETQNVTYIIDREIHMNNGKSFILLEPEIQALLAAMFEEPRPVRLCIEEPTLEETVTVVEEPLVRKKKVTKKK